MAMACFRLVTFLPDRPLLRVPCLRSCMAFFTSLWDFLLYLAAMTVSFAGFLDAAGQGGAAGAPCLVTFEREQHYAGGPVPRSAPASSETTKRTRNTTKSNHAISEERAAMAGAPRAAAIRAKIRKNNASRNMTCSFLEFRARTIDVDAGTQSVPGRRSLV